jgi:hypothetical protein
VTKRKREQREMDPVSTAFTRRAVQLPSRNTWTNNLREVKRTEEKMSRCVAMFDTNMSIVDYYVTDCC